jgi:CRP/FNR family transcriptional regulator, transcriptional activator FtrB
VKPELFPDFRTVPLFSKVGPQELGRLTACSFVQQFPAELVLQSQDATPDFLFAVVSGSVEVTAHHGDAVDTVEVLEPGSVFTLAAVVSNAPALASVRTTMRSRVIMTPASHVRELIAEDNVFAGAVLGALAESTRALVRRLHNQKMRNSTERLANWVANRSRSLGCDRFEIPHQKRVLASLLGMTPENLSRAFGALETHGVMMSGRRVEVVDAEALARLAASTPLIDG